MTTKTAPTMLPPVEKILQDYRLCCVSRQLSVAARIEVHSGRAKFGIFGAGKELVGVSMARAYRPGDWRAGYYRGQTLMLALGLLTPAAYFAQLYAHTDVQVEPNSGGRSMIGHFATRMLDADGRLLPQTDRYNSSPDISPTGGQMPRLVGLAQASSIYRNLPALHGMTDFSHNGGEVAWGVIGNASCAEGMFWEAVNAIGVLQAPAVISIMDDGYGISVPNDMQLMGGNLSSLLAGFKRHGDEGPGYDLYTVRGWDYPGLIEAYYCAAEKARTQHVPALVHITEMTQPQGHSTSGSHERYKSPERLSFEQEYDPITRIRAWLLAEGMAQPRDLDEMEAEAAAEVQRERDAAWARYTAVHKAEAGELADLLDAAADYAPDAEPIIELAARLREMEDPLRKTMLESANAALIQLRTCDDAVRRPIIAWARRMNDDQHAAYARHLYSESPNSPLRVPPAPAEYAVDAPQVYGYEVLQTNFDAMLEHDPRVCIFGEDVGRLGDVNRGVAGLQEKFGPLRVFDTGIRETTIIGQAIGLALRGLRPIAEIQYIDYILYAITTLADDLATTRWRTAGGSAAPVIIRTRGHRLEGIWHSGSPMAALLGLMRGVHLLVPRNMTQAAGFYNTLLRGDDPGIVVEVLNGYRLHERLPANPGRYCVPLGVPEVLRPGDDVTLVTYGACCRIALEAAARLAHVGVEVEVVDVQSLLPFDLPGIIGRSLAKTNRLVVLDEDVPGGASAYIVQQVLERQGGFWQLDGPPRTITAQAHRPAYGTDGDYFSKPNVEDVFEAVYLLLHEADPGRYPLFFR